MIQKINNVIKSITSDGQVDELSTCPPLVFPEEKPGCMVVKMPDEDGCDMLMLMCSNDNGNPGATPPTDGAVTDFGVGEPVTAPSVTSGNGQPITAPTGIVPSGY